MKFKSIYINLHSRKYFWKWCLQSVSYFVLTSVFSWGNRILQIFKGKSLLPVRHQAITRTNVDLCSIGQISVNFESKYKSFISTKCIFHLQIEDHFCSELDVSMPCLPILWPFVSPIYSYDFDFTEIPFCSIHFFICRLLQNLAHVKTQCCHGMCQNIFYSRFGCI